MAVLQDAELQRELRNFAERPAFIARVIERASERGWALERQDIEAALDATSHAWTLSWMYR